MKKREVKGPPSTDLLVCFPTRSHLTLVPKRICSPSGVSNSNNQRNSHSHHRGKSTGGGGGDAGAVWSKRKQLGAELSEPTSPKVTCAGQIKARPKSRSCKNWQSVMEEMERIHNNKKQYHRKKPSWGNAVGFKKESMQFLTSLRNFKFDLGCFGAFPNANVTSDDDDDEGEEHVKKLIGFGGYDDDDVEGSSRIAFSKWIRVLDENQDSALFSKQETENTNDDDDDDDDNDDDDDDDEAQDPCVPPSNALLLMRCRSAPVKSLSEEREEKEVEEENQKEEEQEQDDDDDDHGGDGNDDDDDGNDDGKKRECLIELMKNEGDFYKLSCDIAKETWVVGGINQYPTTQSKKRCSTECLQEVKACLQ